MSSLARSLTRSPAWYGPPSRGILCDLVEDDRAVHPPGRSEGEEGRGISSESKTHVIATLIVRINHNRGGKWRGELLKQGYVLGVTLLRFPRSRLPPPPSRSRFLVLASTPSLFYLFSLSIPLAFRSSRLFQLVILLTHPVRPSSGETVTPSWNCHLIYHGILYRIKSRTNGTAI